VFWFGHHRRLMRQPYGSRPVVFINLFFLLSIILLPVTSSLDGIPLWKASEHGERPSLTRTSRQRP
jgi:uncharacterized membrane protein